MKITVYRGENCWMTEQSGAGSEYLIELFGTKRLPTAFTLTMPKAEVIRRLKALNPLAEIVDGERVGKLV